MAVATTRPPLEQDDARHCVPSAVPGRSLAQLRLAAGSWLLGPGPMGTHGRCVPPQLQMREARGTSRHAPEARLEGGASVPVSVQTRSLWHMQSGCPGNRGAWDTRREQGP